MRLKFLIDKFKITRLWIVPFWRLMPKLNGY